MKQTLLYSMVFILAASLVLAEEIPSETVNAAGLLPSNPLWGLDVAFDKLAINFASDKAKARIAFLDERVSEMVVEKEEKNVAKANAEYDSEVTKLESDSFSDNSVLAYEKHISLLKELQSKLPAQAQQGISRAISNGEKLVIKKMESRVCGNDVIGTKCEAQIRYELNKLKQSSVEKKTNGGTSYGK